MMKSRWWQGALLCASLVVMASEPSSSKHVPFSIVTMDTDPATREAVPGLVKSLQESLSADGMQLEPAEDGEPARAVLRIHIMTLWHQACGGIEINLTGQWKEHPEAGLPPRSAMQRVLIREKKHFAATLNAHALALVRHLSRTAEPGQGGAVEQTWAPIQVLAPGVNPVDAKAMKLVGTAPPLDYPWEARVRRVRGVVAMDILADRKGEVVQASVAEGSPLLADAALYYIFQRRFRVPPEVGGEGLISFKAGIKFSSASSSSVARVVVEVANGKSTERDLQPELGKIGQEVRRLLAEEDVEILEAPDSDLRGSHRLRIEIETLRSSKDILLYGVKAHLQKFSALGVAEAGPAPGEGLVAGQRGMGQFQENLAGSIQDLIRLLVDPPRPKEMETRSSGNPGGGSAPALFDFSQIRIKRQPPAPHYPPEAKSRRIQGTVVVEILVGEDGLPIRGQVLSGPPELMLAALGYALDWNFEPAKLNGVPQKARFKLTMPFKLR